MIIGLTGQSGAGKSTVAAMFAKKGFRVIDCDRIVHTLSRGEKYAGIVKETFGSEYLANGAVDRAKLSARVFSDSASLRKLNAAVYDLILENVVSEIVKAKLDRADAVLDAPLLFEYKLEKLCTVTVGVVTSRELAEQRLAMRDGKSVDEIRGRLASQHDADYFRDHCEYIIENNADTVTLENRFTDFLKTIGR